MNRNRVSDTSRTEDMGSTEVEQRVQQVFGGAERRSPRRRTTVAAVIAAAVLIAGVGVASARVVSNGPEFRTAVAGITDVASELTSVATIEPVTAAAVGFPADGTVESLEVAVGDTVTAGQELASLDETELTRTLNERNEALARAELDLSKALAGEVVAGATVERSGSGEVDLTGSATDSSATTAQFASLEVTEQPAEPQTAAEQGSVTRVAVTQQGSGQGSGSGGESELDQLQQAVLEAQQEVSAALLEAQAALDASDAVCDEVQQDNGTTGAATATAQPGSAAPGDTATGATATGDSATGGSATGGSATGGSATGDIDACRVALVAVQDAQKATASAQQQLVTASDALDRYLAGVASEQPASPAEDGQSRDETASSGSSGGPGAEVSGSDAQSNTATSSPSAAELVAYQKAVDAAQLQVLVALQALARSTIVSPIGGTVVSIGFEPGDTVGASSATQNVTIQGDEGVEVVTTIALGDIASVDLGQSASVLPDGSDEAIAGEVVAISPVPESDSTSYRVTIGLADADVALGSGTTGTVAITTADVEDALAVPSSAVHLDDRGAVVTVEHEGSTEEVRVQIGVTGSDWIEITSGLVEGDVVVLADLTEALPGADTDSGATADDADTAPAVVDARRAGAQVRGAAGGPPGN